MRISDWSSDVCSSDLINAIGGDCPGKTELHRDILARARTFVEFEPQTRIEGEIQQMGADYPVTEFWQVLRGDADGRDDASQITLFDSVGFAIEDFSALRYIHAKIEGSDFFQPIDMLDRKSTRLNSSH